MLLHDIGKSPDSTFRRINQHLETNYGFKISEQASDKDLVAIMEQIEEEITDLKVKGDDAKGSSEISKRLLVLEGLKSLREYAIVQFQSKELEPLISNMIDAIVDHFNKGGVHMAHFDSAVEHAMREYRKSDYDFPNDYIENRIRNGAMTKLQAHNPEDTMGMGNELEGGMMEAKDLEEKKWIKTDPAKKGMFNGKDKSEIDSEKAALKKKHANQEGPISAADKTKMHELEFASRAKSKGGLEEESVYTRMGKRAGAGGGHAAELPDTEAGRRAGAMADKSGLALQPQVSDNDEQVPMIRDKHGRMVPDPFAAQAAARRKGIVMKEHENLVKNLRRLLETEVSQAEVMMAAKGFAQELQEMVEKIGRLQNEDLPPVTDQMRETYGMESASAFQTQIYGALQSVMDALYTAKQQVDDAVGNMASTGQVSAQTDMDLPVDGMDDDMGDDMGGMDADAGMDADLDNIAGDMDAEDEFGGEEALGRSKKMESVLQRKVMEMQRLVAKAKKLKEAKN
jgi:hypothetical protein